MLETLKDKEGPCRHACLQIDVMLNAARFRDEVQTYLKTGESPQVIVFQDEKATMLLSLLQLAKKVRAVADAAADLKVEPGQCDVPEQMKILDAMTSPTAHKLVDNEDFQQCAKEHGFFLVKQVQDATGKIVQLTKGMLSGGAQDWKATLPQGASVEDAVKLTKDSIDTLPGNDVEEALGVLKEARFGVALKFVG